MMTNKTALIIACNLLGDELDDMESDYGVEAKEDPYYAQVQEALYVLTRMIHEEE